MITEGRLHELLAQPNGRDYDLHQRQKEVVAHATGPLWVTAGPGSGKTEVLVTRVLKLLCCDGRPAGAILVTTFTKKAARSLEDRLLNYLAMLQDEEESLVQIDVADLRIGTIHSLANDILQEYRYPDYQNVRLLDDIEQHLFTYRRADLIDHDDVAFWQYFMHTLPRRQQWKPGKGRVPTKWGRAKAAVVLFNHLVEDLVDLSAMASAGSHWATLVDFYRQYREALNAAYRCDFAHLQQRFLAFLQEPPGRRFLDGIDENHPPLEHVLVDEYQDTNPIQERIYLALADREPHYLTVVGDDDQALYRFRGGTVACMVHFDDACQTTWGVMPVQVQLERNYRSHSGIVDFVNDYIVSFEKMQEAGVRAPNKQPLIPSSSIEGEYPAVSWVQRRLVRDLPGAVADLVADHLIGDNVIHDPSQCVLLMRSAKDSARNAGPYIDAFAGREIPVYNPRSKGFMEEQEVACLISALVQTVDPDHTFETYQINGNYPGWVDPLRSSMDQLNTVMDDPAIPTDDLTSYIERSNQRLRELVRQRGFIGVGLLEILHRILAHEPFQTWRKDPSRNHRLSKVTRLFESYQSMNLDALRADGIYLDPSFLNRFYFMFLAYLIEAGVDEDEDEEVVVPEGYLPIMTIHQSKGLEFPFVIVGQLGTSYGPGAAQILENDLAPYRQDLYARPVRPPDELALEDDIRLFYVAYSRAQYGLILVGTSDHIRKHVAAPAADYDRFRRSVPIIG